MLALDLAENARLAIAQARAYEEAVHAKYSDWAVPKQRLRREQGLEQYRLRAVRPEVFGARAGDVVAVPVAEAPAATAKEAIGAIAGARRA